MNLINTCKSVLLVVVITAISHINCLTVNNELPLENRVLQNPNLFGGDMLGINITQYGLRNGMPNENKLWPRGIIPFVIDSELSAERKLILASMDNYHENTCIRFVERSDEYDFVYIFKGDGCYSYVGRTGGRQVLSLANGCHTQGTVVHELGHSVGFYHEHQRSDRDAYIDIHWQNVDDSYGRQFEKLNPEDNKLVADYDYKSIMHYGPTTYAKAPNLVTMTPKMEGKLVEVYDKYGLSELDIAAIQKLYRC